MSPNEAVMKIRLLLGLNESTHKFATATLVDGTKVKTEGELEVGASLMVVTADGDVKAPEGMHETTEGALVTVDEAGVIVKIEEKVTETAAYKPKEGEETKHKMEEVEVEVPNEVSEVLTEEVVQAIVEALAPMVAEIQEIAEELKKVKEQFSSFKAEPAAQKVKRNDFSAERISAVDRILKLRNTK